MKKPLILLLSFLALSNCAPVSLPDPAPSLCNVPDLRPNRALADQAVLLDRAFAEDLAVYQSQRKAFCE